MIKGHGDDAYLYHCPVAVNFSSNVYHNMDLSRLKQHLAQRMELIGRYPEPEPYELEARLAHLHRLLPAEVCVTNGATESIYLIAQAFRESLSAILQPTFSEYADACRMHGHRIVSLYQLPDERSGYRLPEEVQLLWLCNPNNPTGQVVEKKLLCRLLEQNPKVLFVIDQSYEYFTLTPLFSAEEATSYPHLLLLHSMTKRYAIPGLRLGYATGNARMLERLRSQRMPWSVNQLAIEAGRYLLEREDEMDVVAYLSESQRLRQSLIQTGMVEVWETKTHFMLACLRIGRASALKEYLLKEHGLLIRDASNFSGLDERYFRIAAQNPEDNDRLVEAILTFAESAAHSL